MTEQSRETINRTLHVALYAALFAALIGGIVVGRCTADNPEPESPSLTGDIIRCRILGFERPESSFRAWPKRDPWKAGAKEKTP